MFYIVVYLTRDKFLNAPFDLTCSSKCFSGWLILMVSSIYFDGHVCLIDLKLRFQKFKGAISKTVSGKGILGDTLSFQIKTKYSTKNYFLSLKAKQLEMNLQRLPRLVTLSGFSSLF